MYKRKEILLAFSDEEAESETGVDGLTQGQRVRKQQNLALYADSTPKSKLFLWSNRRGEGVGCSKVRKVFQKRQDVSQTGRGG